MKFYNTITIVVSSEQEPWISIENDGIRKTWLTNKTEDDLVLFYYGNVTELKIDEDRIYLPHPEGFINMGRKTISVIEYILNTYDFNYIFKTNTSSYIDLQLLNKYASTKPKEKLYNGIIGNHDGIRFVSGCGVLMSKDVAKLFVENKQDVNHDIIEDVAMGLFFQKYNITPTQGIRHDVVFSNEKSIPSKYFHYRCKDYERNDRSNDIRRMNLIHNIKTINK